jgi:hypothetical protein
MNYKILFFPIVLALSPLMLKAQHAPATVYAKDAADSNRVTRLDADASRHAPKPITKTDSLSLWLQGAEKSARYHSSDIVIPVAEEVGLPQSITPKPIHIRTRLRDFGLKSSIFNSFIIN